MALSVCSAGRPVHIESVANMKTTARMAALRSFLSRRGCPTQTSTEKGSISLGTKCEHLAIQKRLKVTHVESLKSKAAGINLILNMIPL